MKYHVLLLEDIRGQGRKGDLILVAPGFARNFLLPQRKALLASGSTVKLRERLQNERKEQASKDKSESEALAKKLKGRVYSITVRVDPDGHMYGSVSQQDIVDLLAKEGLKLEKRQISITHAIKQIGSSPVTIKLPEGVLAEIAIDVKPDREIKKKAAPKKAEASEEKAEAAEEKKEDENGKEPQKEGEDKGE